MSTTVPGGRGLKLGDGRSITAQRNRLTHDSTRPPGGAAAIETVGQDGTGASCAPRRQAARRPGCGALRRGSGSRYAMATCSAQYEKVPWVFLPQKWNPSSAGSPNGHWHERNGEASLSPKRGAGCFLVAMRAYFQTEVVVPHTYVTC